MPIFFHSPLSSLSIAGMCQSAEDKMMFSSTRLDIIKNQVLRLMSNVLCLEN